MQSPVYDRSKKIEQVTLSPLLSQVSWQNLDGKSKDTQGVPTCGQ